MNRYLIAALALLAFSLPSFAVGPQDVTVQFQSRPGGGPVEGYRLYINDQLIGPVTSGQTLSAAIPGDGTYEFCVNAFNSAGETGGGNCLTLDVGDAPPSPTDVIEVTLQCETTTPVTCVITRTSP